MQNRRLHPIAGPLSLLAAWLFMVAPGISQNAGLGKVTFPTSGHREAQAHFIRGVLFLHSFEYRDAREAFQDARRLDPGFAMAAWGEAMSYNEPLWFAQDAQAARRSLSRLAETPADRLAKAPTDREKAYLGAVEALYGQGTKEERDIAYADVMRRLHEANPDDGEAAAFYALALIGTCHRGRDFRVYMQAAALAEEIYSSNPEHPGALHYLIHAYDDPIHAPLGLRAARVYARVAADAAHALHMPSHIFFALGMWHESVKSNEDAWAASRRSAARRGEPLDAGGYHAMWWLHYAYLQQGRYSDATRILQTAQDEAGGNPPMLPLFHVTQMRIAHSIETGVQYSRSSSTAGLDLPARAGDLYAAAVTALHSGDRASAGTLLEEMRHLGGEASHASASHDHGGHVYAGDSKVAGIMARQLEALLAVADGKTGEALTAMKNAVEIEDSLSYEFGPPLPHKPAHELFGEILLQLGQPRLARVQFEFALLRAPKRALSLLGIARCNEELRDLDAARRSYEELREIWSQADPEVREALEASLARVNGQARLR
ncbi:MAG: tetratricopeptide repeat protein [Bryobacterales bacterium]|nr:tetratricopeptide repeat protein [Bryobacterales bacterium]